MIGFPLVLKVFDGNAINIYQRNMTRPPRCWGLFSQVFIFVDARDDFLTLVKFDDATTSSCIYNIQISGIKVADITEVGYENETLYLVEKGKTSIKLSKISDIMKNGKLGVIVSGSSKVDKVMTLKRPFLGFADCCYVPMKRDTSAALEENLVLILQSDIYDRLEWFRISYNHVKGVIETQATNETVLARKKETHGRTIKKIVSRCYTEVEINRVQHVAAVLYNDGSVDLYYNFRIVQRITPKEVVVTDIEPDRDRFFFLTKSKVMLKKK